jgi:hypothetical protein
MGRGEFFEWLYKHYPAAQVFVECKNYGNEIGNPEIDQLAGRFSPSRGMFGILVSRSVADRDRLKKRCKDTAVDGRGYIVVLVDKDLATLVGERKNELNPDPFKILRTQFEQLIG